jgi:hypothetical protein
VHRTTICNNELAAGIAGVAMEADPPPTKKTNEGCLLRAGLGLVVCVLCVVCVYNGWRQAALQDTVALLEQRVRALEGKALDGVDVLVERFRREADDQAKRRQARDVAAQGGDRSARDAPECICPAGKRVQYIF